MLDSAHFTHLPKAEEVPLATCLTDIGERPASVGLICSGVVKLLSSAQEGALTVGLRSTGWWLNATSLLMGSPSHYRVVTLTQCRISMINVDEFTRLLQDPAILRVLLAQQSEYLLLLERAQVKSGTLTVNTFF